ncbi:MAG: type IV conjugative transfer system coupling protein TraD [Gammaproteobacteria bacterium]|nr:type IV conjugative transfer system coupling protein TraD [Gammaproteobacteria bacterium]
MAKYRYEALLRPPHERVATYTYLSAAAALVVGSELAFLVPTIAYSGALFFGYRGIKRWREASRILKYQKGIRNLPLYIMRSEDLKISYKQQYLGQGFKWTTKHAQRLYDLELSQNEKYEDQSKGYHRARRFCYQHENDAWAKPIIKYLDGSTLNPWKPLPDLGGRPALHAVGMLEGEEEVLQSLESRVAHTFVQGTTRVGKTRLAELLISQDIARGDVVIVFDPKGDADLFLRCYTECKKAGRLDNFYGFHLGFPEESAQYNPIGNFLRLTEVASRIANQMPGEGQSLAFREFVWGYVNQITKGIVGLGKTPSYELLKVYSQDMEPLFVEYMGQLFEKYIGSDYKYEIAKIEKALPLKPEERRAAGIDIRLPRSMQDRGDFGKAHYIFYLQNRDKMSLQSTEEDTALSLMKGYQTDQSYMAKLVASLDPFLAKMTTGAVSKLIAPNFEDLSKDTFSWSQIIQSGGVVYVGLDALSDPEVAATVGNSMFSDLTSVAGRLYKHGKHHGLPNYKNTGYEPKIDLHADEFNELAGAEFIPMLNKAGGAGIQVTAYTQTAADIRARLGDVSKAQQMEGNFNTLIMLRVLNEETAKLLTDKQSTVTVSHMQDISGATDNPNIDSEVHFTSATQTRDIATETDLIRTTDLVKLPKGQAFALLDGNKPYKIRIPWLKQNPNEKLPSSIRQVADNMRERYQSVNDDWYKYKEYFDPISVINTNLKSNQTGFDSFVANELKLIGDPNEF